MANLNFKQFMKKDNIKKDTVNESELHRLHIYDIYPRDSKIYSDKGFVDIDNGNMGRTHWTSFHTQDNKSFYFNSCGGQPHKLLPNQLPKPVSYHKCKIQHINFRLWGSYCLHFFYSIERLKYYDAF